LGGTSPTRFFDPEDREEIAMRRRFPIAAWSAVLAMSALLGTSSSVLLAEETAQAASLDVAVTTDASAMPHDGVAGAPLEGAAVGDVGPGCGGYGGYGFVPAVCLPRDYLQPHLFYNFYVGGNCGSIPAGMYPSPMPTPPVVGHTFYTYQPLLPHEHMYAHKRVYHHHYNLNRGLTRTRVFYMW
jgi:hypothetical protein